jgi:hypothetical protein
MNFVMISLGSIFHEILFLIRYFVKSLLLHFPILCVLLTFLNCSTVDKYRCRVSVPIVE